MTYFMKNEWIKIKWNLMLYELNTSLPDYDH